VRIYAPILISGSNVRVPHARILFLLGVARGQLWPYMRMHIGSLTIPALNPVEKTTINIVSKWFDL